MKNKKKYYKGYSFYKRGNSFFIRATFKGVTYRETFYPPEGLTESKEYEAAEKEAIRFRDYVRAGYSTTMPKFGSYANYVIETKKNIDRAPNTTTQYEYLLPRLNEEFENDLLDHITPQRLNKFYGKLSTSLTYAPPSALAIEDKIQNYIKNQKLSFRKISELSGISTGTVSLAIKGNKVKYESAEKICKALEISPDNYFYKIINAKPISNSTLHSHIKLLNTIFKTAKKERILEYNPVDGSNIPKREKNTSLKYNQPEEIIRMFDCLYQEPIKWQAIISLYAVTACRRGEVLGIQRDKILWDLNLIKIDHEVLYDSKIGIYTRDETKNGEEKYVEVDIQTMDILKEYVAWTDNMMQTLNIPPKDYPKYLFFQSQDFNKPMMPSSVNNYLKEFASKYGFETTNPHSFRHSLASALIADGIGDYYVARQLGHKNVTTTREIYIHQIREHQAKVTERIPQIYNRTNSSPKE